MLLRGLRPGLLACALALPGLAPASDASPAVQRHCVAAAAGFAFEDTADGPTVAAVFPDSPARRAGLMSGDVLREMGTTPLGQAADLSAAMSERAGPGPLILGVVRVGEKRQVVVDVVRTSVVECIAVGATTAAVDAGTSPATPGDVAPTPQPDGAAKALIAVGGVEVKAAKASGAIGDGLREMMVTALHDSGYFVVVERINLKDLTEHAFAAAQARDGRPPGLDVAELVVFAAVTEFEPKAGGSSFMNFMPGVPLGVGAQISYAELALDMRVIDVASGRVLAAQRVPGMARSARGSISAVIPLGAVGVPMGLEAYRGTPMEWAIRDCIHKMTLSIANSIPVEYFRHR